MNMSMDIIKSSGLSLEKQSHLVSEPDLQVNQKIQKIEKQFQIAAEFFNNRLNQLHLENCTLHQRIDEMAMQRDEDLLEAAKEIEVLYEKHQEHEISIQEKSEKIEVLERKLDESNQKSEKLQSEIFEQQDSLKKGEFDLKDFKARLEDVEKENRQWKEERLAKLWKEYIQPAPTRYANMSRFGILAFASHPITAGVVAGGIYLAARFYFSPKVQARLLKEIKELSLALGKNFDADLKYAEDEIFNNEHSDSISYST